MSLLGGLLGGAIRPIADAAGRTLEAREATKQAREDAWARAAVASKSWRPWLAKATGRCLVLYVLCTAAMVLTTFVGIAAGWGWATLTPNGPMDLLWTRWIALGSELFTFAALFLTTYAAARTVGQFAASNGGQGFAGLGGSVRGLLGRPDVEPPAAEVDRRAVRRTGAVERMPGVVVRSPTPPQQAFGAPPTSYFTPEEFACKGTTCGCTSPPMDPRLLDVLNEDVRAVFGPTVITSGYRCPTHNAAVGGSDASFHMRAMAADIRVPGVEPRAIYEYLDRMYPGQFGLGLYKTFVHVDVRPAPGARKPGPDAPWARLSPDIELT